MDVDGPYSVAFPRRAWYPVCRSRDIARRPTGVTLWDEPVAVFRDAGGTARALVDRCAHRNVRLSLGRVTADGCVECPYHGWRYDGSGRCTTVPGLAGTVPAASPTVGAYTSTERDGFVWVWADLGGAPPPDSAPFPLPSFPDRGSGEVVFTKDLDATLHAALENHLDVPHTAFLHGGIFRGAGSTNEITAVRRDVPGGIEVRYLGEPVGMGPFRARRGTAATFDHWDRFFLPGIAQIEYRVEGWLRIVNTILHLPLSPFRTRAWFVVRYWSRLPAGVAKPLVLGRGLQLLRQDGAMLAEQTRAIRAAGGERYTSTDLDLFGNAIRIALRRAERGTNDGADDAPAASERTVVFRA